MVAIKNLKTWNLKLHFMPRANICGCPDHAFSQPLCTCRIITLAKFILLYSESNKIRFVVWASATVGVLVHCATCTIDCFATDLPESWRYVYSLCRPVEMFAWPVNTVYRLTAGSLFLESLKEAFLRGDCNDQGCQYRPILQTLVFKT